MRWSAVGSLESLARSGLKLVDGLAIRVHNGDELEPDGVVSDSAEEGIRVAAIDWSAVRRLTPSTLTR